MDHSVVGTLAAAAAYVGRDRPANLAWVCVTMSASWYAPRARVHPARDDSLERPGACARYELLHQRLRKWRVDRKLEGAFVCHVRTNVVVELRYH